MSVEDRDQDRGRDYGTYGEAHKDYHNKDSHFWLPIFGWFSAITDFFK